MLVKQYWHAQALQDFINLWQKLLRLYTILEIFGKNFSGFARFKKYLAKAFQILSTFGTSSSQRWQSGAPSWTSLGFDFEIFMKLVCLHLEIGVGILLTDLKNEK